MSTTTKKCSVCRRPCAGHPGCRFGPTCTNIPLTDQQFLEVYGHPDKEVPQTRSGTDTETVSSPTTDVYGTPSATAPWLARTSGHQTAPATASQQPPVQAGPGQSQTGQQQCIAGGAVPSTVQPAVTAPASGESANAEQQINPEQGSESVPQTTISQVNQYISPMQMVDNIRPAYSSMGQYVPTWSTTRPHMSVAQQCPTMPNAYSGIAQEVVELRRQLSRLEGALSLQQTVPGTVGAPATIWSVTGVAGPARQPAPAPSPAAAGLTTGVSINDVTNYSRLMFTQSQGLGYNIPYTTQAPAMMGHQQAGQAAAPGQLYVPTVQPGQPGLTDHAAAHGQVATPAPVTVDGLRSLGQLGDLSRYAAFPGMQEKTIRTAVTGMFVNLDEFLVTSHGDNPNEGQLVMDPLTHNVTYKPFTATRKVTNFATWLEAYLNYIKVMVNAHGISAYYSMVDYITFIQKNDARFYWYAVDSFDEQHRQWLSGKSINMLNVDPITVAATLVSTAAKQEARCTKCRSPDHSTAECPAAAAMPPSGRRNRSSSRGKREEICKNFNRKNCTFQGCKRLHRCIVCKGDLPAKECLIRGPCSQQDAP